MIEWAHPASLWLLLPAVVLWWWSTHRSIVDRPARSFWWAAGLRLAAIVCVILALARPTLPLLQERQHVVFLVDVSHSQSIDGIDAHLAEIEAAIDGLESDDSWQLFAVGSEIQTVADPETLRGRLRDWRDHTGAAGLRDASRLAAGLARVRAAFPGGFAHRLIISSDGRPTDADLAPVLTRLAEEGVDVHWWRTPGLDEAEALVASLTPSVAKAYDGEVVRFTARVRANRAMPATLRLLHRGVVVDRQQLQLTAGADRDVVFDMPMVVAGASDWTAELVPAEDHFTANNSASTTVAVAGEPRILVLHENPRAMRGFARALEGQDFAVDVRAEHGLPADMNGLLAFDAVVLAQVPATRMSTRQMTNLQRFVGDFGGGLMMLGSEESFGLGGYYQTPIEEALPLVSRYEKEKEKPSLALMLVIDKSGSMQGLPISLARQAAKAASEMLSPRDQVAVVGFDGSPFVACDLTFAGDIGSIHNAIDRLAADGGTNMYPAMTLAYDMLQRTAAQMKHMIILGDGQSQPADFAGITRRCADAGISVSTVALGGGADRALMETIAEIGNGRSYQTMDPSQVPQIFTKETMEASRSAIKEDVFTAVPVDDHPMLAGTDVSALPVSFGYVMTQPKPTAQVLVAHDSGDPLLAVSRFGLGTGVAFTADLSERWGGDWLAWDGMGKFWAQVLRSLVRKADASGMLVDQRLSDDRWHIDLERRDERGEPMTDVRWHALLMDGQGGQFEPPVRTIGYGRYELSIDTTGIDRATLQLRDLDADKSTDLHFQRPYPAEFALAKAADPALADLQTLAPADLGRSVRSVEERSSIAHWFIALALALLGGGVLFRRL